MAPLAPHVASICKGTDMSTWNNTRCEHDVPYAAKCPNCTADAITKIKAAAERCAHCASKDLQIRTLLEECAALRYHLSGFGCAVDGV